VFAARKRPFNRNAHPRNGQDITSNASKYREIDGMFLPPTENISIQTRVCAADERFDLRNSGKLTPHFEEHIYVGQVEEGQRGIDTS
jgi:hypothetical protein